MVPLTPRIPFADTHRGLKRSAGCIEQDMGWGICMQAAQLITSLLTLLRKNPEVTITI